MKGEVAIWPEGKKSEGVTKRQGEGKEALHLTEETRPQLAAEKKVPPPIQEDMKDQPSVRTKIMVLQQFYIYISESFCCTAETQHWKAIILQLKKKVYLEFQISISFYATSIKLPCY